MFAWVAIAAFWVVAQCSVPLRVIDNVALSRAHMTSDVLVPQSLLPNVSVGTVFTARIVRFIQTPADVTLRNVQVRVVNSFARGPFVAVPSSTYDALGLYTAGKFRVLIQAPHHESHASLQSPAAAASKELPGITDECFAKMSHRGIAIYKQFHSAIRLLNYHQTLGELENIIERHSSWPRPEISGLDIAEIEEMISRETRNLCFRQVVLFYFHCFMDDNSALHALPEQETIEFIQDKGVDITGFALQILKYLRKHPGAGHIGDMINSGQTGCIFVDAIKRNASNEYSAIEALAIITHIAKSTTNSIVFLQCLFGISAVAKDNQKAIIMALRAIIYDEPCLWEGVDIAWFRDALDAPPVPQLCAMSLGTASIPTRQTLATNQFSQPNTDGDYGLLLTFEGDDNSPCQSYDCFSNALGLATPVMVEETKEDFGIYSEDTSMNLSWIDALVGPNEPSTDVKNFETENGMDSDFGKIKRNAKKEYEPMDPAMFRTMKHSVVFDTTDSSEDELDYTNHGNIQYRNVRHSNSADSVYLLHRQILLGVPRTASNEAVAFEGQNSGRHGSLSERMFYGLRRTARSLRKGIRNVGAMAIAQRTPGARLHRDDESAVAASYFTSWLSSPRREDLEYELDVVHRPHTCRRSFSDSILSKRRASFTALSISSDGHDGNTVLTADESVAKSHSSKASAVSVKQLSNNENFVIDRIAQVVRTNIAWLCFPEIAIDAPRTALLPLARLMTRTDTAIQSSEIVATREELLSAVQEQREQARSILRLIDAYVVSGSSALRGPNGLMISDLILDLVFAAMRGVDTRVLDANLPEMHEWMNRNDMLVMLYLARDNALSGLARLFAVSHILLCSDKDVQELRMQALRLWLLEVFNKGDLLETSAARHFVYFLKLD